MQANAFADEKMKVLYALLFMRGGMAQVWVANETSYNWNIPDADIGHHSGECQENFRRPGLGTDGSPQLHELRMTPGTTAEDYMAQFEMLAGRTGFSNNAALKDIYVRGLPNPILQKIFAQVTLPNGLAAWKTVIRNLNHLHQSLTELKRSTGQTNPSVGHTSQTVSQAKPQAATTASQSTHVTVNPQASDSATPMDVNLQKARPKTQKCYNCQKIGHLVNNFPEPHKQWARNDFLEMDISDIITKAIATTLDDWEKQKEAKAEVKMDF